MRHHIGRRSDFTPGVGRRFELEGRGVAVFRRGEDFFAVGDSCPHAGASLSEGYLAGGTVVCPWHGWMFDLKDGCSPFDEDATLPVYAVLIEDEDVFVVVGSPEPATCPAALVRDLDPAPEES